MEDLDREFLAWLAGFWEGEGCLQASEKHSRIQIKQTDPEILNAIRDKIGVGYVRLSERKKKHTQLDSWVWSVDRRYDVIKVVELLIPLMRFRRVEAEAKLELLHKREQRFDTSRNRWKHFTLEEVEFIRKNYLRMTYQEIADKLGRTRAGVLKRLRRMGLRKGYIKKYDWDTWKRDYLSGMSTTEIGRKYGSNAKTVWNALSKMGVTRNHVEAGLLWRAKLRGMPKNVEVAKFTIDNEGTKVEWKI